LSCGALRSTRCEACTTFQPEILHYISRSRAERPPFLMPSGRLVTEASASEADALLRRRTAVRRATCGKVPEAHPVLRLPLPTDSPPESGRPLRSKCSVISSSDFSAQ
jgi:hypothetical protein